MQTISPHDYEQFVIKHLSDKPVSLDEQRNHITYSLEEELLELPNSIRYIEIVENWLEIWQNKKPKVKYMRSEGKTPSETDIKIFMANTIATRSFDDGRQSVSKTFDQHVEDIRFEYHNALDKIKDELGDLLFFIVAAKSDQIKAMNSTIENAISEYQKNRDAFGFTDSEIRQANYNKLFAGKNARYSGSYNTREDLLRPNE